MEGEFEVHYDKKDLTNGICTCCKEYSKEIIKQDGRCTDCFEEERFFDMTMNVDRKDKKR